MIKIKYKIEIWIAVCVIGAFICSSCSGGGGGGGGGGNGGGNHRHNTPPRNNAPSLVFGWANTPITFRVNPSDTDTPAQTLTCEVVGNSCPGGALDDCVWSWTPSEAQAPTSCEVVTRVYDGKNYSSEVTTRVKVYGDADINTCYILDADFQVPGNSVTLTQPKDGECTYFYRQEMSLTDSKSFVDVGMDWRIDGSRFIATLKVTNNNSPDVMQRVWLTTHALMGGSDEIYPASDGYIGDGVYYFLRNLDPGESVSVEVAYDITPGAVFFRSILDVVTVADRIGFDYVTADNTEEIWSAPKDGGTEFPVFQEEPGIYAIYPTFSQDGGWVAFTWGMPPEAEVWIARMDGGGGFPLTCYGGTEFTVPGDFTPDAKKLIVRHGEDYSGGDIHNYLLDIAAAMDGCSNKTAMTQMTPSLPGKNEILASAAPDGTFIVYGRLELENVEPPYPCLDPPLCTKPPGICCPAWAFGSETKYGVTRLYLRRTDPATGLATGEEKLFWGEDALMTGLAYVTPDSRGAIFQVANGCSHWKYFCNPSTCQWYMGCTFALQTKRIDYDSGTAAFHVGATLKAGTSTAIIKYISGTTVAGSLWVENISGGGFVRDAVLSDNDPVSPGHAVLYAPPIPGIVPVQYENPVKYTDGLYKLQIPSDWSTLPYSYRANTSMYTQYYGFITRSDPLAESPFWCWQSSDRVVFKNSGNNVSDCYSTNCANDRRLLVDLPYYIYSPKCTQAVGDP